MIQKNDFQKVTFAILLFELKSYYLWNFAGEIATATWIHLRILRLWKKIPVGPFSSSCWKAGRARTVVTVVIPPNFTCTYYCTKSAKQQVCCLFQQGNLVSQWNLSSLSSLFSCISIKFPIEKSIKANYWNAEMHVS